MKLEQAARQALEALEVSTDWDVGAKGKQLKSMRAITALREALDHSGEATDMVAEQEKQEPVAIGSEWKPCMKLPVVVHVREQREGESHVSTREGITPVRPDDLIMRGVAGEEYPIGRELFNKTYTFDTAAPVRTKDLTDDEIHKLVKQVRFDGMTDRTFQFARAVIQEFRRKNGIV